MGTPDIHKKEKRKSALIDWVVFGAILVAWVLFESNDPGELVFLLVFENACMLLAMILFIGTFGAWDMLQTDIKRDGWKGSWYLVPIAPFLTILVFIFQLGGVFLAIFLVNQIAIEFLIAYMCENGFCQYETLNALSKGFYLESSVIKEIWSNHGIGISTMTAIFVLRYYREIALGVLKAKGEDNKLEVSLYYFFRIVGSSGATAIGILIACLLWVILHEIIGDAAWIMWPVLILFRLLYQRLMRFVDSIFREEEKSK
jgi:hypothetical protein